MQPRCSMNCKDSSRKRAASALIAMLDLDLLLFGAERIDTPRLTVPHPRMNERAFVLVPLAEIAPQLVLQAQLQSVAGQRIDRC